MPTIDTTRDPPLNNSSVEPQMPTSAATNDDVAQILFCKVFHLNNYRKDLIRRDAAGENVTTPYADATAEVQSCLAKLEALANRTLAVIAFPAPAEIQRLTSAMREMESAITNSAVVTSLVRSGDTVINTIAARGIH